LFINNFFVCSVIDWLFYLLTKNRFFLINHAGLFISLLHTPEHELFLIKESMIETFTNLPYFYTFISDNSAELSANSIYSSYF